MAARSRMAAPSRQPDDDDPETWRRETVQLRCQAGVKGKWFHARQLARRVAGENLPPWMCAEYMAAEVLSALGLEVEIEGEEEGGRGPG